MHVLDLGLIDRRYALVLEPGEEVVGAIERFLVAHDVQSASLNAIGALSGAVLGFFDLTTKDYVRIDVEQQVEALTITGNAGRFEGRPRLHLHAVLGYADGTCVGGHLIEAYVDPTLEVIIDVTSAAIERAVDVRTGLPLITPNR